MHNNRSRLFNLIIALTLIMSVTGPLGTTGQTITATFTSSVITLPGNSGPLNTGIFVHMNEFVQIRASGEIFNGLVTFTPDGWLEPPDPQYGTTILPNVASNSLVGSIGDFSSGVLLDDGVDINPSGNSGTEVGYPGLFGPGYVGSYFGAVAQTDGYIYLAFNDYPLDDNTGSFTVNITILPVTYSISGMVRDGNNNPIPSVRVATTQGNYTFTDANGSYTITGLVTGTYTVTSSLSGHSFWPHSRTTTVPPNLSQQNFYEWICGLSEVPLYLQGAPSTPPTLPNHPYWYDDVYGNYQDGDTYNTVGRWGCNMSSAAMIISYFGRAYESPFVTDPGILNNWLRNHNGYDRDNGVIYSRVAEYAWSEGVSAFVAAFGGRDDQKLDEHLCAGFPAMLRVTSPYGTHYVVVNGKINVNGQSTYTINDPAQGYTTLLAQYNDDYQEIFYYVDAPACYDKSMLEISAHSPVHLVLIDPLGRKSGFDPRTSTLWAEIPNAGYSYSSIAGPDGNTLPESKVLIIPRPIAGQYIVEVIGYAIGPYEIDIYSTDASGRISQTGFSGVANIDSVFDYTITVRSKIFLPLVLRSL